MRAGSLERTGKPGLWVEQEREKREPRSLVQIKGCPTGGMQEAWNRTDGSGPVSGSATSFPWELKVTLLLCALSPKRAGVEDP